MLIRTLTRAAGRLTFRPGDRIDLPAAEALELVRSGQAERIEPAQTPAIAVSTANTVGRATDQPAIPASTANTVGRATDQPPVPAQPAKPKRRKK